MKRKIALIFILMINSFIFGFESSNQRALEMVKEGSIEEYPNIPIKDAATNSLLSIKCYVDQSINGQLVTVEGYLNLKSFANNLFLNEDIQAYLAESETDEEDFSSLLYFTILYLIKEGKIGYVFNLDSSTQEVSIDSFYINDYVINTNDTNYDETKDLLLAVLFSDSDYIYQLIKEDSDSQLSTTTEYTPKDLEYDSSIENLEWYILEDEVTSKTCDTPPYMVTIKLALAYKSIDKNTEDEISQRTIEIKSFLRRYIQTKTREELSDVNDENIKREIIEALNDKLLSSSRIQDIDFLKKEISD